MPPCKHGNLCKIKNCPLKHVAEEELEECVFYKQGFCYNGPKCGRRHVRKTPEECPVEANFESITGLTAGGKKMKTATPNDNFKVTLCTHWLMNGTCPFNNDCHFAHGEDQINEGFQPNSDFLQDTDIYDPTANRTDAPLQLPFPTTSKFSYFILQSPDLRSLSISKRRNVWAVPLRMVNEINTALRMSEHVILFMSVRPLRGIYGILKITNNIPLMPQIGPAMSAEFPIVWIRTMRLSLRTIAQLKLGMTGMFVGRSATDGRFEPKVGMDLLLTSYRKPEWDWNSSPEMLAQAEHNIRVIDPGRGNTTGDVGEYYPSNNISASNSRLLPPDVLFSQDWLERAALNPNDKFGHNTKSNNFTTSTTTVAALPPIPDFYTGNHPGFIFCAIKPVIEEMIARHLLGLPIQLKDIQIQPNVPLFIFDTMAQMLLGIFYADSPINMNIEPMAFTSWLGVGPNGGSPLPVQLRFRIAIEIPPTSIHDAEIMKVLGGDIKTIGGVLPPTETRNLANLLAKRVQSIQMLTTINRFGKTSTNVTTSGSGLFYKPPYKCIDIVPIEIKGNMFDIKRRLLGNNASSIMKIVDSIGTKHNIRVRIRGQGSGFLEGPQNIELQEPLHFNISTENEFLLNAVKEKIIQHISSVRNEIQYGNNSGGNSGGGGMHY